MPKSSNKVTNCPHFFILCRSIWSASGIYWLLSTSLTDLGCPPEMRAGIEEVKAGPPSPREWVPCMYGIHPCCFPGGATLLSETFIFNYGMVVLYNLYYYRLHWEIVLPPFSNPIDRVSLKGIFKGAEIQLTTCDRCDGAH